MKNTKITIGCLSPTLALIIFLAFFFAKIYNLINWPWWLVFSPLWVPLAIIIGLIIIFSIIYLITIIIDLWK